MLSASRLLSRKAAPATADASAPAAAVCRAKRAAAGTPTSTEERLGGALWTLGGGVEACPARGRARWLAGR